MQPLVLISRALVPLDFEQRGFLAAQTFDLRVGLDLPVLSRRTLAAGHSGGSGRPVASAVS